MAWDFTKWTTTKILQIIALGSKLVPPRGSLYIMPVGSDSHYVHIVKTENKINVFWMGERYSLDIWLEMLFGGPVSRLFWIKPLSQNVALPKGTVNDFFDVQQWNFDHVHGFSLISGDLDFDDVTYFLSFDVQLWNLNHVHRLRCKANFDISWPRLWQSVLLLCPLK
jgi:hypothetical protein